MYPWNADQRWSVVSAGGRYYAVHAQHVDAFILDPERIQDPVANPDLPCLLQSSDATLVSFYGMTFIEFSWWSYHWVEGQGTWTNQGL